MNFTANRAGHFGLLAVMAAFIIWFTLDAWKAAPTFINMILIGPVAAGTLLIIAFIAVKLILNPQLDAEGEIDPDSDGSIRSRYGVGIAIAMLAVYIGALEVIGFDVASFMFCALTMILLGLRNWLGILVYSLVMGIGPVYVLVHFMGVPVKNLVVGG